MLEYHQMLDELKVVANDMQLTKQRLKLQDETRRRKQRDARQELEDKAADTRDAANAMRRDKWSNSPPSGEDAMDDAARRVRIFICVCLSGICCSLYVAACICSVAKASSWRTPADKSLDGHAAGFNHQHGGGSDEGEEAAAVGEQARVPEHRRRFYSHVRVCFSWD